MSESRTLRNRAADADAAADNARSDKPPGCAAAMLVTTTTVTTYPTSAAAYYACNPTYAGGAEVEGGAASYYVDTSTVLYGLNEGTQVPPNGTRVVLHAASGRWEFRYDG